MKKKLVLFATTALLMSTTSALANTSTPTNLSTELSTTSTRAVDKSWININVMNFDNTQFNSGLITLTSGTEHVLVLNGSFTYGGGDLDLEDIVLVSSYTGSGTIENCKIVSLDNTTRTGRFEYTLRLNADDTGKQYFPIQIKDNLDNERIVTPYSQTQTIEYTAPEKPTDPVVEPELPVEPETPVTPEEPVTPETPVTPEEPVTPETPVEPEKPTVTPETPVEPEKPTVIPETPVEPEKPAVVTPKVTTTPVKKSEVAPEKPVEQSELPTEPVKAKLPATGSSDSILWQIVGGIIITLTAILVSKFMFKRDK